MTTTATEFVKPERIYDPLQFELHDAPEDVKAYSLLQTLGTGELITNDVLMNAITMGFNMLPRMAPTPGDRVRITELLTDEVRHCYMNDHLARALGGDPSKLDFFSASGDFAFADGVAAAMPSGGEELGMPALAVPDINELAERFGGFESFGIIQQLLAGGVAEGLSGGSASSFGPNYLWTLFAVFNTCVDRVAGMMVKNTINSSFAPLARMNRGIAIDEAGHAQAGFHHLRDICATKEGREEAQSVLDMIWRFTQVMFSVVPPGVEAANLRLGLAERTHAELQEEFVEVTVPLLEGLGLCVPEAA